MNPYNPNELYHHQRIGSHWGIMNGPPYPLDRKQLSSSQRKASKETGYKNAKEREKERRRNSNTVRYKEVDNDEKRNQNGSGGIDLKAAKQLSDETIKATKGVAKIVDKAASKKNAPKLDTSKLTDKEMQDYIRRANLEKNYKQLKAEEYAAGRRQTSDYLDTFGDILTTAGSILRVIILAKALSNK